MGLIAGIVGVLVLGGGAVWFFMLRDDGSTTTPATAGDPGTAAVSGGVAATDAPTSSGSSAGTPANLSGMDKAPAPANGTSDGTAGSTADGTGASGGTVGGAAAGSDPDLAGLEKAAPQAETAKAVDVPEEPLPTLIEFEPIPPIPGTEDQIEEWSTMVAELYITDGGATGRRRNRLKGKVEELDPIDALPAYINALNGVDIGERSALRNTFSLVRDWQDRVANTPRFSFPGDDTRMDTKVQNLRITTIELWRNWWLDDRKAGADPDVLQDYRLKVAKAQAKRGER